MWQRLLLSALGILVVASHVVGQDEPEPESKPQYTATTTIDPQIPMDQLQVLVKPLTKAELQVEADAWFTLLRSKARQIAAVRLGVKKTNEAIGSDDEQAAQSSLKVAEKLSENSQAQAEEEEQEITEAAQKNLGVEEDMPVEDMPVEEADDEQDSQENATDETASNTQAEPTTTGDSAIIMKDELLSNVNELQDQRTALSDRLEIVLDSLESKGGEVEEYRSYALAVSGIELDTTDITSAWAGMLGWLQSKEGGQRMAWNLGKFLLVLLLTYLIAKLIASVVNWALERKITLSKLAERLISRTIKNLVMLIGFAIALTTLEIDITPVLAAIGATGLVVGLALQGTLSNFASGLMILINRPFDVGNVVTAAGVTGTIDQMNLVSTTFRTFDNQTIHVPNNEIWNNVITNITANPTRRVDLEFGIGYDDDFEQAEKLILEVVKAHELVLDDPAPVVVTHALADSSVNIVCRPWAKTGDWWQVRTEITRGVKRKFDLAGISIPYPQQDVHVHSSSEKG